MCRWDPGLRASRRLCGSGAEGAEAHFLWADWPHLLFVTCWWAEGPGGNGWSQRGVPPSPTPLSSSTLARGDQEPLPPRRPAGGICQLAHPSGLSLGTDLGGWCPLLITPTAPPSQARQPKSREAGVLLRARPWPAPLPAPREVPDAAPLAPTGGRWAPPAICSEMSFDPASRPAQQDFWHLGHRRQTRGMSDPRWWERRERLCRWDWAVRPPLGSWLWLGQGSRWGE